MKPIISYVLKVVSKFESTVLANPQYYNAEPKLIVILVNPKITSTA